MSRRGGRRNRGRFCERSYESFAPRALRVAAPLDWDKGTLSAARRGGSYQRSRVFPLPPLSLPPRTPRASSSFVYPRFAARRCYRLTSSSYWFYLSRTHPAGPPVSQPVGAQDRRRKLRCPGCLHSSSNGNAIAKPRESREALLARFIASFRHLIEQIDDSLHETHLEILGYL